LSEEVRGTGLTTAQMHHAPHESVFVWVNYNFAYPRALAKYLRREDLKIVSPGWLDTPVSSRYYSIVVDHGAHLNSRQHQNLMDWVVRGRNRNR
jgi:uncharacterized protein Usg